MDIKESSASGTALLVIAGPTAGGKSELALRLAEEVRGEIVSLDSVQIYRGADIGSAKATVAERAAVPHHLIDIRDPLQSFSAAEYVRECETALAEIRARGNTPMLVGGTTLYLTALLHGLAELKQITPGVRAQLAVYDNAQLYAELERCDPARAASLHPHDRFRVERALASVLEFGIQASAAQAAHRFAKILHAALIVVVCPPRTELYGRVNLRAQQMVEQGILEETRDLVARFGENLPLLRALGYQQCLACLQGRLVPEKLSAEIAMCTRRFAKRQVTYWRNEPAKRGWKVSDESELGSLAPQRSVRRSSAATPCCQAHKVDFPELCLGLQSQLSSLVGEVVVRFVAGVEY